ncbi:hypothetical protein [Pseudonocardia sp. EC080625-04]|uniref:hypothetical protein n=1 Tax=Pseudonocardia sp. EC080625-04 TaxID=1096868 RepID=UPI0009EAF77F
MAELERENRELRRANAILKLASTFFAAELYRPRQVVFDYIEEHRKMFGVEPICAVLNDVGVKIAPRARQGHDHELCARSRSLPPYLEVLTAALRERDTGLSSTS